LRPFFFVTFKGKRMKLYYAAGACSLAAHIALAEAGLAYEAIAVNLKTHTLADGSDYRAINPLGYVPFMVLSDGKTLSECAVLVQYIADQAPAKNLISIAGSMARYEQQVLLNITATELHKGFSPLWNPNLPAEVKEGAKQRVLGRMAHLDSILAKHEYLTGNNYGVDDIYAFVVTSWAGVMGMDTSALTHLNAWRARIAARPAVQKTLKAEGLI
jgi:glutathione S-transferase